MIDTNTNIPIGAFRNSSLLEMLNTKECLVISFGILLILLLALINLSNTYAYKKSELVKTIIQNSEKVKYSRDLEISEKSLRTMRLSQLEAICKINGIET